MSLTQSFGGQYSLTYDKYSMMLQNACIRYDKDLKHKPSPTSRAVYQHNTADDDMHILEEEEDLMDNEDDPYEIGSTHDGSYHIHKTNSRRQPHIKPFNTRKPYDKSNLPSPKPRYNGPVYLPRHIYHMLHEDAKKGPRSI